MIPAFDTAPYTTVTIAMSEEGGWHPGGGREGGGPLFAESGTTHSGMYAHQSMYTYTNTRHSIRWLHGKAFIYCCAAPLMLSALPTLQSQEEVY